MKIIVFCLIFLQSFQVVSQETIHATVVDPTSENYKESLEGYKKDDAWALWSMPIGRPSASRELSASRGSTYSVNNALDYNLNTAWVIGRRNGSDVDYIAFTFEFPVNTEYAGAYQFFGICNLFNGYCKSIELWKANSRVKNLKVYYNNEFICNVELCDTWHFQSFDISKFFVNRREGKYLDAKYEIKNGDVLMFKITEVFDGDKYNDIAISEFLCEGASN